MSQADRNAVIGAARQLKIWQPAPVAGIALPESKTARPMSTWAIVTVAADGSLAAGRAERTRFEETGAVVDPAVAPAAVPSVDRLADALDELDPSPRMTKEEALERAKISDWPTDDMTFADMLFRTPPPECGEHFGWADGSGGGIGYGAGGSHPHNARFAVIVKKSAAPPQAGWPLVLADAGASAERVLEVLARLPGARAVAVQSGGHVYASGVVLCDGGHRSAAFPITIEGAGDLAGLRAAVDAERAKVGKLEAVVLRLGAGVTHGELVAALDALLDAGITSVDLQSQEAVPEQKGVPKLTIGKPKLELTPYDLQAVRRVIRRIIPNLRYCYEKQLVADPGLDNGAVTATFVIAKDGTVAMSTADGISDGVSMCVAEVIKKMKFPAPEDGVVKVTYPFTYERSGG
jgi:biopolymer transport protein ExbD